MPSKKIKKPLFARIRNYFFAGAVVLIPLGITLYLTLFIIKISTKILPKELNPNHYLPIDIPGIEIFIAILFITFIGWLSLSFLGKKIIELLNNLLKRIILHNRGKGAKFTRGRKWFLMYYETFKSKNKAMKREYEIKKDKKFREKIKLR